MQRLLRALQTAHLRCVSVATAKNCCIAEPQDELITYARETRTRMSSGTRLKRGLRGMTRCCRSTSQPSCSWGSEFTQGANDQVDTSPPGPLSHGPLEIMPRQRAGQTPASSIGVESARLLSPTPLGYLPSAAGMCSLLHRKMLSPCFLGD